jgi:broad specificity phosphatase PhoE
VRVTHDPEANAAHVALTDMSGGAGVSGRVLLISCGATSATRRSAFPTDEPLIEDDVTSLADELSSSRRWSRHTEPGRAVLSGPELRCRQTAEALGLTPAPDSALADWNLGAWAGRTLDELLATDPAAVQGWLTDPAFAPPSGEPLTTFLGRVATWLDTTLTADAPEAATGEVRRAGVAGASSSSIVVVCTSAVIRAALTHALQAPAATFWRLDVAPARTVELTGTPGRWSLRV